jgi:hypothetical protein
MVKITKIIDTNKNTKPRIRIDYFENKTNLSLYFLT